jgi:endoglucanase
MAIFRHRAAQLVIVLVLVISVAVLVLANRAASPAAPRLRVSGPLLVNQDNQPVILRGVDRSGGEYACVQGQGIFVGPADQSSVSAMKSWGINAVRLPLNEACWNGESYAPRRYSGKTYQHVVESYVNLLVANGITVILDLHWTDGRYTGPSHGCSSAEAVCQKPMPDAAQSIPFWASVASIFKGNGNIIFDLFNEPYPDRALSSPRAAWQCWLHGGGYCSPGIDYQVAGMQNLVDAVRSAGANNVIMVGGLSFSNNLTQWLQHTPYDPDHALIASWHSYNFNSCSAEECWQAEIAPVIARIPVIADEIGENDCGDRYVTPLMSWLDQRATGYLAWSWNPAPACNGMENLITGSAGTPTAYGAGIRAHLRSLASEQHAAQAT